MSDHRPSNNTTQDDERRKHLRLDKSSSIRYQFLQNLASQDEMKKAELCDFSGGGIRFLTKEPLTKNEQLVIELHFVGWKEVEDDWVRTGDDKDIGQLNAVGAVMWCSQKNTPTDTYEIGLRFTGRVR